MIDHISVGTNDLGKARTFYDAVLAELGIRLLSSSNRSADYGVSSILFSIETPVTARGLPAATGPTSLLLPAAERS